MRGFITALGAKLSRFSKSALAGEAVVFTDIQRAFVATSTAGASDASLLEIATLKGNTPISAASPTLDMTYNNRVVPVDASANAVDFQLADDVVVSGFRCTLQVLDGTYDVSVSRSGTTATVNGGASKTYATPTSYTLIHISSGEDNKLVIAKSDP